ncbi:MAG: ATP synthase F1 subunit delta [Melioribacteraceae bacterium]|nr:ATP synthase F1 subunit delta [Melioribacteraceae bacterium]
MSVLNISTRYALAFMDSSKEKGILEDVSKDVEFVYNTFLGSSDLKKFIVSPVIKQSLKAESVEKIFSGKVNDSVIAFLKFILSKGRAPHLFSILKRFKEISDERLGIMDAFVSSSVELDESQRKSFLSLLEAKTNKKIRTHFKSDSNLLGGFMIKVGDTVYDASVNHQLETLKKNLLGEVK